MPYRILFLTYCKRDKISLSNHLMTDPKEHLTENTVFVAVHVYVIPVILLSNTLNHHLMVMM